MTIQASIYLFDCFLLPPSGGLYVMMYRHKRPEQPGHLFTQPTAKVSQQSLQINTTTATTDIIRWSVPTSPDILICCPSSFPQPTVQVPLLCCTHNLPYHTTQHTGQVTRWLEASDSSEMWRSAKHGSKVRNDEKHAI